MEEFTPPFPAYPSGHATFGAACFTVLRLFRAEAGRGNGGSLDGNRLDITLHSDELNPQTRDHRTGEPRPLRQRTFTRIQATAAEKVAMIDENARSRIFQGVHWQFDGDEGIASGNEVGRFVFAGAYNIGGK